MSPKSSFKNTVHHLKVFEVGQEDRGFDNSRDRDSHMLEYRFDVVKYLFRLACHIGPADCPGFRFQADLSGEKVGATDLDH